MDILWRVERLRINNNIFSISPNGTAVLHFVVKFSILTVADSNDMSF